MKIRILFILTISFALINVCRAQQSAAELLLPQGLLLDGSAQELRFSVTGVNWSYPTQKTYGAALAQVPGMLYFNPVVTEGLSNGYCEIRISAHSKEELQTLLRSVFCTLDIQSVKLNQNAFDSCQLIVVP